MDWFAPISRHLFAPLYARRDGAPLRSVLGDFLRTQRMPLAELQARQWKRLQELVCHAAERSPFYRERFERCGFKPRSFTPEDFRSIPPLTKAEIRKNGESLIAEGWPRQDLVPRKTGGSTSDPLRFFVDHDSNSRKNAYAQTRNAWTGWFPGDKVAMIWGATDLAESWKVWLRNKLYTRAIALDTLRLDSGMMHDFAREMVRFRPKVVFGHSHSIYLMTRFLARHGYSVPSVRTITSTSTVLTDVERAAMEEFFQCPVFDRYGCEEVSLIASECECHNGMHLNIDHLYIEFISHGQPVPEGECGDIHVTDLTNRGMPFIRYRIEDAGTPTTRTCPCGRTLPLMEKVQGRVADFIVTPEGKLLFGVSILDNFTAKHLAIERVQIIQESIDHLTFRIVRGEDFNDEKFAAFRAAIPDFFGPSIRSEFQFVDEIMRERSGKYRFTISKLADPIAEAAEQVAALSRK